MLCIHIHIYIYEYIHILKSHSDFNELVRIVNAELKKVVDFFRIHKLALHPSKTKFMVFSNSAEVRARDCSILMNCNNDSDSPHLA